MKGLRDLALKGIKHVKGYNDPTSIKQTKLVFDVDRYLIGNKGYSRTEMPQIDWEEFKLILPQFEMVTKISKGELPPSAMKPTQNEINMEKVLKKIAKGKNVCYDYTYIVDKDFFILDGHHRHVRTLMTDPYKPVSYIRFDDIDIDELIYMFTTVVNSTKIDINDNIVEMLEDARESYGQQGPGAVPGMGAVEFPTVATDVGGAMNPANRGSGDIPIVHGDDDEEKKIKYQNF